MKVSSTRFFALAVLVTSTAALNVKAVQKIVLTNDDGWAVAQIRDEYKQLRAAGFEVILSAPAVDKSGTGRNTTTPAPLTTPCEFNTCLVGAPANGTDPHDENVHYVNGFPADSVRLGIQDFAEARWGTKPDFVVAGTNIGNNLGPVVLVSGTVGAATEAAKEGVPSFAFSGASGAFVSYTTLTDHHAQSTIDANIYTSLVLKFLATYLPNCASSILPPGTSVNINFSATSSCDNDANEFKWIATRINKSTAGVDTKMCGTNSLPDETTVSGSGCFVTLSVMNATTLGDVSAAEQKAVFDRLHPLLTCL